MNKHSRQEMELMLIECHMALRLGVSHLSNPLEFDHLIDVHHARVQPNYLTPLPMVAER